MATTVTKQETLFGKRVRRQEDPRLITGTALYLDDLKMPGMHHAIVVRSPYGAANIKGIDTKAALATAGRGGGLHRRGREESGRGAMRGVAARTARAASSSAGAGPRLLRGTSGGRSGGHRPLHRARRGRPGGSGVRRVAGRSTDPEKALAAGRPGGASRVARQRRVHLPPGGRRHRTRLSATPT